MTPMIKGFALMNLKDPTQFKQFGEEVARLVTQRIGPTTPLTRAAFTSTRAFPPAGTWALQQQAASFWHKTPGFHLEAALDPVPTAQGRVDSLALSVVGGPIPRFFRFEPNSVTGNLEAFSQLVQMILQRTPGYDQAIFVSQHFVEIHF